VLNQKNLFWLENKNHAVMIDNSLSLHRQKIDALNNSNKKL
jgi:hypothetical protein